MLRSRLLVAILLLSAFLFSCSGEDGATGPAGPAGKNGNANVIAFQYPSQTATGLFNYYFDASQGMVDSCLVLGYYVPSNLPTFWYAVPGLGPSSSYMTRFSLNPGGTANQWLYQVQLRTPDGTGNYTTSTTFTKFKIFLVPPSTITILTSRGLDLSDYNAVAKYLNLSE
jgi:hypothetical protein